MATKTTTTTNNAALDEQDKIKKSEIASKIMDISGTLKMAKENIIVTSSETRYGKEKVLDKIEQLLANFKPEENEVKDEDLGD